MGSSDCQANAMCFSVGQLDLAEKFGVGCSFTFGDGLFEDKNICVGAFNAFRGGTVFTSALCQAEKALAVEISQVAFSGTE